MNWLIVIIVAAAICGIIGFFSSKDGERGKGAAEGAVSGAVGCGAIIFQLLLGAVSLGLFLMLIRWLFS
ncbi:MAG: hypothetical protein E7131_04830 [Rikenellaceae bacterium]|nr:hypothetical protein [Rikenellaceae bacterium]